MNEKAAAHYYEALNRLHKDLEKIESIDSHLKNVREYIAISRGMDQKIVDSLRKIHLRTEETLQQLKKIAQITGPSSNQPADGRGPHIAAVESTDISRRFDMVNKYLEATKEVLILNANTQKKLVGQNDHLETQLEGLQKKLEFLETRLRDMERVFSAQSPDFRSQLENFFTNLAQSYGSISKRFTDFEEHAFFLIRNFHESVNLKANINMGITVIIGLLLLLVLLLRT